MKRYPLLLLAASLFFSSFKSDETKSVSPEKVKPAVFTDSYVWHGSLYTGSSEFGYYNIPLQANIIYYTQLVPPFANIITSVSMSSDPYSQTYTYITGSPGTTTYHVQYTPSAATHTIQGSGASVALFFNGYITITKTVKEPNKPDKVTSTGAFGSATPTIYASSLPPEILP